MPLKNKEEYNTYMRNHMRKKSRENTGKPLLNNDFDPSSAAEGKPILEISKTGDLIKQTQELLKTSKTDPEAKEDPIIQAIDKYGKYIPLVLNFLKGFQGSVAQYNKQDKTPKLQAPDGWLNATPMQKLGLKYSRSEWYAAGERYDAAVELGHTNPQVDISHVDPNYSTDSSNPKPQNLRQLAKKYPEAPIVQDSPPQTPPQTQQVDLKNENNGKESKAIGNKSLKKEDKIETLPVENHAEDKIITELQQDNAKYLNLGAEYINGLKDEEFKNHLKNIDDLIEKSKPFIPLLPVQVKGMILQTSKKDLEALFEEKCLEKYKIVVKEKLIKKLLELFEKLKDSIK